MGRVAVIAAGAGVHGGHQHEAAGEHRAARHPAHRYLAVLHGLTQNLQCVPLELRQFVQKQHTVVGKAHLAGAGHTAAARQGRRADAVVRAAEGPVAVQPAAGQKPGHGVDLCGLQRFGLLHGRQNAGQALGQHGFARARAADEQNVVAAGGSDLHGPAGGRLAPHIRKVRQFLRLSGGEAGGGRRGQFVLPPQMGHHLAGVGRAVHGKPLHHGGLGGVGLGHEQGAGPLLRRRQRHGQHAGHGAKLPVQRKLPDEGKALVHRGQLAAGAEQGQQHRQVVHGAGFAHIGRGQVYGDAADRPGVAQVFQGTAHPVGGFFYGTVRQAHQGQGGQAGGQVCLCGDGEAGQPSQAQAGDLCKHGGASFPAAQSGQCTRLAAIKDSLIKSIRHRPGLYNTQRLTEKREMYRNRKNNEKKRNEGESWTVCRALLPLTRHGFAFIIKASERAGNAGAQTGETAPCARRALATAPW